MAIKRIVAIRDRAVDGFGIPIFVHHINEGIRTFKDEINREGSVFGAHPDDYDLYHVGDFNDATGEITPIKPSQLAIGKSMVVDLTKE